MHMGSFLLERPAIKSQEKNGNNFS